MSLPLTDGKKYFGYNLNVSKIVTGLIKKIVAIDFSRIFEKDFAKDLTRIRLKVILAVLLSYLK